MNLDYAAKLDVEQRILAMFDLVDSGKADQTVGYVTDDFTFRLGPNELDRDGFAAAMQQRAAATHISRHAVSNLRVIEQDPGTVQVAYITAAHRREDGAAEPHVLVGDTEDTWIHDSGEWKLQRRSMGLAFPAAD